MTRAPPTSLENSIMGLDGLQEKNDLGHHSDDKLPSSDAGREKPCPSGEGHSQSAGYTGSKERVTVDNIPPGRISSGAEPNRNSERDTHGTCPLGERLTNLGHFKEANKEVSITESARRDGQNFEGGCEVGEETRSPAIYEQEMLRRGCCSEVVEVQVSEDDENREDHTGTLRLRGSPAFSGVTSLTRARDCSSPIRKSDELESRISLSVLAELSALSGFLVSGSHAAKDIEMAEKSWKILAPWNWVQGVEFESSKRTQQQHVNQIGSSSSEALVLSLENKVPTQATSQDLFPFGGEAVQALLAHDEHEVNDFQKQPESHRQSGTPLTGIESTEGQISSISTKGGALFSLENNPLATIEPVRKPIGSCITASDLAEALKTAEIHVIISEIFKQLTPSWAVQTSLSSWLMQSLITQHREAGPVHVWASGSPKPNQGQQHESNEGTGNQNPEGNEDESLDEYLEYMDPDAIDPPEFVVSMLRNRGFPVPGDPGYKSWLEEYRKSRRLKPASQPEDLNPTDLGTFDDLDYLWGMPDPDLGFLEDLDMASPIRTTGNSKEPEGHAQSSADVGSLDLQDLGTQNAQNNPDDDSRNTNKLQYSEITNVDLEMRESYNKQILRWTRLLLAIKKRPTWWDQPDRGERLVGLIQELQRDSVQAFAQIDAAPGTRTPPNVELAQKLGQEFEQSSDVQGWYAAQEEDTEYFKRVMYGADEMDDLVEMRQILKRLDDMRRQPPQFQDAESHSQFASTIGTFYSVLIQTIERIYGEGAKDVLIDELLKFRDQFPDQSLNNVPSHQDFFNNFKDQGFQPFDTNINVDYYDTDDIELQETTLETRRRQRSQDTDTNQERAKKAARDTTKEAHPADTAAQLPHLQKAPGIMEKLISSSILEWMKGLYIMRSKAARFSPTDHQLASALLAPQLRALYLDVLTSGEATFGATISDVTDEKCESTREEYRQRISRNPKVADQVAKQMTGDVSNLLMDDELKLVAWMVQYLNIATVLRNMATPPDPAGKLERSALLRAFVEELRETASSILEAEDIEAFEVPQSALSAAREAAQKYHDKFVLRVREQRAQEQQKKQEALREQRRQQKEAAAPSAPRAANLPRQGNVGTSSVREEDAEDGTPMSPLRPPSSPLNLEPEEVRKIRAPAERRSIADAQVKGTFRKGWKVEGLAVPKNFTRADMAHYEEYLSLTYQELRRLMFEIACAIMGRVNFTNMKPPLPTDLQFYLTAYYRLAAGQVAHSDRTCNSSRSPLDCCYTKKFGTSLLEADREKRHKVLIEQFIKDIFQRFMLYCKKSRKEINRVPEVIRKRLMDWLAGHGYNLEPEKIKELAEEIGIDKSQIKDWINEEREASIAAVEAARQNEAQGAPPGPRPLPVDTGNHLSVVNGKARLILKHWVEQHHEYPFTIKKERKELAELTGLDKKIVKRFINVYRKYNKHRLNMERDLHRHNEMNLTGHGRDFGPRYRLVGATIEVPESEFVGQWQPEPPPPTIAPTIAPSSVEDDLSDTESGDEEGVDEELDKDVDKEVAKVLGRRAVDSDSEGSGEDGDEVENYEKMIESQLDILRQYVQEGKMTLEEAQAVAGEGEGGMNEDRELENVVLDELAVAFLPQLTDPDIKQRWRRVFMVGGSQYISKRWIPSPSVDEDPFDLVARAKEQVTANVGPKVAKVAWNRMKEDFKCLIAAHQSFANGVRAHYKTSCNPSDDPGTCCYNDRFGSIDHISGANDRMIASLPMFDVDIARISYLVLNSREGSKSWTRWSIPLDAAVEIEKWIVEWRQTHPGQRWKFPTTEQYDIWEKKFGLPERQAFGFIRQWRQKCLVSNKEEGPGSGIRHDVRDAVTYFRNWFEENLDNPYLTAEQTAPYSEKLNVSFKEVRNIISNIRRENKHRIREDFFVENQVHHRFREHREGDELLRGRNYYREFPPE